MSETDWESEMKKVLCPEKRSYMGKLWQKTKMCELLKKSNMSWKDRYIEYIALLLKMHTGKNSSVFMDGNEKLKVRDVLDKEFPFLKHGRLGQYGNPTSGYGDGEDMWSGGKIIYPKFFTHQEAVELFKAGDNVNHYKNLAIKMIDFKGENKNIAVGPYQKKINDSILGKKFQVKQGGRRTRRRRRRKSTKKKRRRKSTKKKRRRKRRKSRK